MDAFCFIFLAPPECNSLTDHADRVSFVRLQLRSSRSPRRGGRERPDVPQLQRRVYRTSRGLDHAAGLVEFNRWGLLGRRSSAGTGKPFRVTDAVGHSGQTLRLIGGCAEFLWIQVRKRRIFRQRRESGEESTGPVPEATGSRARRGPGWAVRDRGTDWPGCSRDGLCGSGHRVG